jgi:acyl-CoA dehydrogenase
LKIPAENLIGEEGKGFKYILDGLNAERGRSLPQSVSGTPTGSLIVHAITPNERVVFDRPIGQNQGVQFPIADSFIETEAANLNAL